MQIIHWLFKVAQEKERDNPSITSSTELNSNDQQATVKDIVVFKQSRSQPRSERGKHRKFGLAFLCRKDVATACFYSTIHLKRINSYNRRKQHWMWSMKMKKEETVKAQAMSTTTTTTSNKVDSSAAASHGSNKVLPVTETALSSDQCSSLEKVKGDKSKAISRIKDLIKWAAAAKSEKKGKFLRRKVLHFRNKASLKPMADDDQMSNNESPKISFRWDVESCSTITSSCSGISMADLSLNINSTPLHHRKGNWITTDSEFVVLEL